MKTNYQIGDLIIGKVTNVKPYALFLKFENGVNGLLHISEISDNYIRDIEKYGVVGDEIKVKVLSIDETNGFLRVSYKSVPKEEFYSTHKANNRTTPVFEQSSFNTLKEKLPIWIKETLEKADKEND